MNQLRLWPWLSSCLALGILGCGAASQMVGSPPGDVHDETAALEDVKDEPADTVSLTPDDGPEPEGEPDVAGDVPVAGEDAIQADEEIAAPLPCSCDDVSHCDSTGKCVPDVCTKSTATCGGRTIQRVCTADGSSATDVPCATGEVCDLGECKAPICEPGSPPTCDGAVRVACNSLGTGYVPLPCPASTSCNDGQCEPVQANVLLVVDTSGSMNEIVATGEPASLCFEGDCPPWEYPNCDDPVSPKTRIGLVKKALSTLLTNEAAKAAQIGLVHFPQRQGNWGDCDEGYYEGLDKITGDDDQHIAGAWFDAHLSEVVAVPPVSGADQSKLLSWVDGVETLQSTGATCVNDWDCASNICIAEKCLTHKAPELRCDGATPLGKTVFYAGEYLRKFVLVEGKPCAVTADCASAHYACVDGSCHDPASACRPNVFIVLSDGGETEDTAATSFFHPRVQAKRMRYGLGCVNPSDCGPDAICESGVCVPPANAVPWTSNVCAIQDLACGPGQPCPDYGCTLAGACPDECVAGAITVTEFGPTNRLTNLAGSPTTVTLHVIDASGAKAGASLLAAYGGGTTTAVDFADLDSLVTTLLGLIKATDVKTGSSCQ